MTLEEKIETVKNIVKAAALTGQVVVVEFVKKDGSPRQMVCQRSKVLEDAVAEPPDQSTVKRRETLRRRNMLCVAERTASGPQWRTISMETVTFMSFAGRTFEF